MDTAENKEEELTPQERAEVRELLRLLRLSKRRVGNGDVDESKNRRVKPARKFDAAEHVTKLRRKKGMRANG